MVADKEAAPAGAEVRQAARVARVVVEGQMVVVALLAALEARVDDRGS